MPTSVVAPLVPRTKSKFAPIVHVSVVAEIDAPATKLPCDGIRTLHREQRARLVDAVDGDVGELRLQLRRIVQEVVAIAETHIGLHEEVADIEVLADFGAEERAQRIGVIATAIVRLKPSPLPGDAVVGFGIALLAHRHAIDAELRA